MPVRLFVRHAVCCTLRWDVAVIADVACRVVPDELSALSPVIDYILPTRDLSDPFLPVLVSWANRTADGGDDAIVGANYRATLSPGIATVAGVTAPAIRLDANQSVTLNVDVCDGGALTIVVRLRFATPLPEGAVLLTSGGESAGERGAALVYALGRVRAVYRGVARVWQCSLSPLPPGDWVVITFTVDPTAGLAVYVDGRLACLDFLPAKRVVAMAARQVESLLIGRPAVPQVAYTGSPMDVEMLQLYCDRAQDLARNGHITLRESCTLIY